MSVLGKEWEIKLELLRAITHSQAALARMLDSVADVTGASELSAAAVKEHVRVLTNLQGAMLSSVTRTSWRPPSSGRSAPPWLSAEVLNVNSQRHSEVVRIDA